MESYRPASRLPLASAALISVAMFPPARLRIAARLMHPARRWHRLPWYHLPALMVPCRRASRPPLVSVAVVPPARPADSRPPDGILPRWGGVSILFARVFLVEFPYKGL